MEKCPDCGRQFKNARWPPAVGSPASDGGYPTKSGHDAATGGTAPGCCDATPPAQPAAKTPEVLVRIGGHDLTPQEFNKFVNEMLMVRAALARAR